ncbi:MAG: formylmethanofuran dehydrogenase subunit C [Pirellulaceae bacterium]|jgi:formylmethanofuran dehydrogenase subunit C|nr:formylmethanofuran dehydrogenase subunit C [Pirellulaceae bacterium]MDP6553291.1 formylmethanofuran dehydrogenase subunit C [Pirellulaceae bacterium]MDP6721095.1 formylmethanofuran dehydrogenase subunit C [Pirellulaceae bacterium]
MVLSLSFKSPAAVPLEVEGLTPEHLRSKSLAEIERSTVFLGNRKVPLGDYFRASGDPSDSVVHWEGDLTGVHWIGAKMTEGEIRVIGNAGRHVGSEMQGGCIVVEGDAGDWVGGELKGGLIHVQGRAGHLIGAAYRGSARGMSGGTILVNGDVGNEIGHSMRRGTLAVGGNTGDLVGFNMLAGSVLTLGETGIRHGAGMHRGTLGFFGSKAPPLLPTFRHACRYRPEFLQLMFTHLRRLGFPIPDELSELEVDLYHGDMIEGGRGEILIRAA